VGWVVRADWRGGFAVSGLAVGQFADPEFSKELPRGRQAAVRSAGVVVGRVEKIVFDDKSFQARVTLAMEDRYRFPKDSSLKILTSGLLGEQYLGLEPGAEEKTLAAGDLISSTQSAVVLESLISQFLYSKAADGKTPDADSPKK
jgi:phospholipid/cholesterol/gamma-HCH transport system substrate-binding protein